MNTKLGMHNPPHPGKIVKHSLIDNTTITVTKAAEMLGVGRVTFSKLINGHSGISPVVTDQCKLTCAYAGVISVDKPGRNSVDE